MDKNIKTFKSVKEALDSILRLDEEYRILTHKFAAGNRIKKHSRPDVHEWVILDEGEFNFFLDDKRLKITPKDATIVIAIPPKTVHGLMVRSESAYLAVRSGTA